MECDGQAPDGLRPARLAYDSGRYDEALHLASRVIEHGAQVDRPWALLLRAAIHADRGADQHALRDVNAAEGLGRQQAVAAEASCIRALLSSQRGDRGATVAAARDAEHRGVTRGRVRRGWKVLTVIESLARVGDEAAAWSWLDRLGGPGEHLLQRSLALASLHARHGDPSLGTQGCRYVSRHPDLPERERWRLHLLRGLAEHRAGSGDAVDAIAAAVEGAARIDGPSVVGRREPQVAAQLVSLARRHPKTGGIDVRPVTELRVLGGVRILRGGLDVEVPEGLGRHLLGSLAIAGGQLPAAELADRLWPSATTAAGLRRLRDLHRRLREQVGDLVVRRGEHLTLGDAVQVDLHRFLRTARLLVTGAPATSGLRGRALAADACATYGGPLLPGIPGDERVRETRADAAKLFRQVARLRVAQLLEDGRPEDATRLQDRARD